MRTTTRCTAPSVARPRASARPPTAALSRAAPLTQRRAPLPTGVITGHLPRAVATHAVAEMKALIFDCDGVILDSEELHRVAYNDSFERFDVRINGERVVWTEAYYDDLQNKVGGGKPKMRYFFGGHGWPTTTAAGGAHTNTPPASDAEREAVVDDLQAWKSERYRAIVKKVDTRPGVLRLMDEARAAGLALGVCSAGTKDSVVSVLHAMLGEGRFKGLDVFLTGDDVPVKKPDPLIYKEAAACLGLDPASCVVVEDSAIGAASATGAGMRCVITYTRSTANQTFPGAERVVAALTHEDGRPAVTVAELARGGVVQDDRMEFSQ